MKTILSFLFIISTYFCFSQTKVKDTVTRTATIIVDKKGNKISLKPQTPTLIQMAGAPKSSYSYFWETGDGNYTKEPEPKHVYKKKKEYKVNLSVTNNYDNGKPPKTRPVTVAVNEIEDTNYSQIASLQDTIQYKIFTNREPVPEEEMVVVVSYKNPLNYVANGKLYLFYNDVAFKNDNFNLIETRTHFDEKEVKEAGFAFSDEINNSNEYLVSNDNKTIEKNIKEEENLELTLLESKTLFRNVSVLEYDAMDPNETRNVFFTFKTTPEMLKDTSAIVKMRGIYVPDRSYKNHKKKTLEMEIVTSHDPNKMSSNGSLINYRLVKFKALNFKTRFQNNGEGPAKTIRLETDIPDMFDKTTFKVIDMYPKCPICPKNEIVNYSCLDTIIKKNQIHFTFKNIYLPGSTQKNVKEKDSTKGFVKYSLRFGKDFHKTKTKSKTSIFFDKNEPIITNYATTRFKPGISVGVKTGYNYYPKLDNAKSFFAGATISPYKSYRWYWQLEMINHVIEYNAKTTIKEEFIIGTVGVNQLLRTTTSYSNKTMNIEVPVLIRYNINNYIGVGAGINANFNTYQKVALEIKKELFEGQSPDVFIDSKVTNTENKESLKGLNSGLLLDFTGGFSRIGPSLGVRYVLNFEKEFNYLHLYAIWKF